MDTHSYACIIIAYRFIRYLKCGWSSMSQKMILYITIINDNILRSVSLSITLLKSGLQEDFHKDSGINYT